MLIGFTFYRGERNHFFLCNFLPSIHGGQNSTLHNVWCGGNQFFRYYTTCGGNQIFRHYTTCGENLIFNFCFKTVWNFTKIRTFFNLRNTYSLYKSGKKKTYTHNITYQFLKLSQLFIYSWGISTQKYSPKFSYLKKHVRIKI